MSKVAPWVLVVGVGLGLLAGWGAHASFGAAPDSTGALDQAPALEAAARSPSSSPSRSIDDDARPLQLLERCAARLTDARERLARCPDPSSPSDDPLPTLAACLRHPEIRSICPDPIPSDLDVGTTGPGPEESSSDSSPSLPTDDVPFARRFATTVVGTTPDESQWLETYLCTVDRLRTQMVDDLRALLDRDAPLPEIEALITETKDERAAVLVDLEQRLGAERYQRLRSVGGLGILGAALDCAEPS